MQSNTAIEFDSRIQLLLLIHGLSTITRSRKTALKKLFFKKNVVSNEFCSCLLFKKLLIYD